MVTFIQLKDIANGTVLNHYKDRPVRHFLTDSRKLTLLPDALFVAIKGEIHNGHHFIQKLYDEGIRQFLVEEENHNLYSTLHEANILKVEDSISALQKIVAYHRSKFEIPIIGITGSNGKTIIKEWLSQMLDVRLKTVKSPKSYNSQLGVPLSVWQLDENHQIGVFEAGISKSGEMAALERVIKPDIGIFTNIGSAHNKGFSSQQEKIEEKIKLFQHAKVVIHCKDHTDIHRALEKRLQSRQKLFTWSSTQAADVIIKSIDRKNNSSAIKILHNDDTFFIKAPFSDDASIENIITCITTCLYLNFSPKMIQRGIDNISPVSMRLSLKRGINNCYLIDDTYNNDLAGLRIALDFLGLQNPDKKKTVIISDILEAGVEKSQLYRKVSDLINKKMVSRLIGIGPDLTANHKIFKIPAQFYDTTEAFIQDFNTHTFKDEVILLKGARKFALEKIVGKLQQKTHGTIMEINLDALTHNLNFYRSQLNPGVKILVMIKAFAYGSGFLEIANLLQFHRVDYLGVAYPDEGILLRQNGIHLPILVMNASPESFEKLIEYNLEPEVYSLTMMKAFIDFLVSHQYKSKIHVKLDTGMHRLGFNVDDLPELAEILSNNTSVEIATIFSHLAGSEAAQYDEFSRKQVTIFEKGVRFLKDTLNIDPVTHILKSSGIIRFPQYHFDMVRLGIGLHGIGFDDNLLKDLEPVATLKTTISQINQVKKGETIGYDRKGKAEKDSEIATLAIGYADGFDRRFSNGAGRVLINGKLAPVIGNVCMDMTMVDVTGMHAREGDEVIIFGKGRPLKEVAKSIDTIPYELLTKVSERVKRVFYVE